MHGFSTNFQGVFTPIGSRADYKHTEAILFSTAFCVSDGEWGKRFLSVHICMYADCFLQNENE